MTLMRGVESFICFADGLTEPEVGEKTGEDVHDYIEFEVNYMDAAETGRRCRLPENFTRGNILGSGISKKQM